MTRTFMSDGMRYPASSIPSRPHRRPIFSRLKAVAYGPRNLPHLPLRAHRRLGLRRPPARAEAEAGSSDPPFGWRGAHARDPLPVAALQERARLLAVRRRSSARVLP